MDQTTQPPDDPPPEILQLFAAGFTAAELHAVADALDFRITFAHEDGPPIRRGDIQWTPKKLAAYRAMAKRNRR